MAQALCHERIHHTHELDYQCPLCDKAFPFRGDLNSHIKNVHKIKNVNSAGVEDVDSLKIEMVVGG